jgi:hypothetical protein
MSDRELIAHPRADRAQSTPSNLMLIGTVSTPDGARALLRQGTDVLRVTVGDTVDALTVTAIAEGAIHLARGSEQTVLHIPG